MKKVLTLYQPAFEEATAATTGAAPDGAEAPEAPVQPPVSPAAERFRTCRWRRPAENGTPECCGHRDVLPMTGAHGFDPAAWCLECQLYKLRRTPKKREEPLDRYTY